MSIILFSFLLKGCKKAGDETNLNTDSEAKAAAIKAVIAQYGNVSKAIIFPMDKTAEDLFYKDNQGNMVQFNNANSSSAVPSCTFNCSNTTDPNNLIQTYTLKYVQRNYICETNDKSDLMANWRISVPYTPLLASPGNPANLSYGRIRITGGGSTATSANITGITIRSAGPDATCTGHNLYDITYTFKSIANSYFTNIFLEASLYLYNDCSLVGNLVQTGYVSGPIAPNQTSENLYNVPCERTDKVWINPGNAGNPATALGCYTICWYPSPNFTPVTNQQVQWRKKTSTTSNHWDDQTSVVNSPAPMNPYTGLINLIPMYNGSGTWVVRYRNRAADCLSPNANWTGVYVTEIWSL